MGISVENSNDKNTEIDANKEDRKSLDFEIDQFITDVSALSSSFPIVKKAMEDWSQDKQTKVINFLQTNTTPFEENGKKQLLIDVEHVREFEIIAAQLRIAISAKCTLYQNFITAAISILDVFIVRVMNWVYITQPGLISASEKSFTYKDILELGSFDSVRDRIISSEIESFDRLDYSEKLKMLDKNKHLVDITKKFSKLKTLLEVSARRNIYVHNNGIVNQKYIDVCKKYEIAYDNKFENSYENHYLEVTAEYLECAIKSILEYGFIFSQEIWRHFKPEDILNADRNVNRIGFDLLQNGDYELARMILQYAYEVKPHPAEETRKMILLNLAQTYKWTGDEKTCQKIINKEDWSESNDFIKLGREVLLENNQDVYKLMKKIGTSDDHVSKESYRTWPIFLKIRQEPEFQVCFNDIFNEQLLTIDPKVLNIARPTSDAVGNCPGDEEDNKQSIAV